MLICFIDKNKQPDMNDTDYSTPVGNPTYSLPKKISYKFNLV